MPDFIDKAKAELKIKEMEKANIIYGGSLSYRHMCRFFSGKFYNHELLKEYDYYWRIEPDVSFFCKMNYDPFDYLESNGLLYGFSITINEFMETIPSLWQTTIEFLEKHRNILMNNEIMKFILDDKKNYNGCHFWSNFEIASFKVYRNEVYEKYFEYLDRAGGFYYERWGDAPVHSIAMALFYGRDKVHFFDDIGYRHTGYQYCPTMPSMKINCKCDVKDNYDRSFGGCLREYRREYL